MYYVELNDASLFELTDIITETTTDLKGERLKALALDVQNANIDLIRSSFQSEFNTRTIKLLSEGKVLMTTYNNYTILRSIATDEQDLVDNPENLKYRVILAMPSDVGTIVPQLQERIQEMEAQLVTLTAEPDPTQMELPELKEYKIAQSKANLEAYLAANPVTSSCHGEPAQYACTLEKQSLLNNAIAMAEIHASVGDDEYKISWNATGEECTYDWTKEQLVQLAIEIEAFVKPLISQQQAMESMIKAAESKEDVNAVNINFPSSIVVGPSSSTEGSTETEPGSTVTTPESTEESDTASETNSETVADGTETTEPTA